MNPYFVADVQDLPAGTHKIVEASGLSIGVYNIDGEYFAILNYCPHQGAELCKGPVCGTTLPSAVYEFNYGHDQEIVRCPWHGWEFEITTGRSLFSDKVRIKSFPVRLIDGKVYVER